MKTKWFFTGILSIMLIFGLFLIGCDDGSGDGSGGGPGNDDDNGGGDSGITITLTYNPDDPNHGYQKIYDATSLFNGKITAGDEYTFIYTFTSNTYMDFLRIVLVDNSPAVSYWKALSYYNTYLAENISPGYEYSGVVTISAIDSASSADAAANKLSFDTGGGTTSSPTVTFTTFWFGKSSDRVNHTVTFNSNGGSSVSNQSVLTGNKATRPSNPTQSGYTFVNWYSDSGLSHPYDFDTPVTGNITLYAKWDVYTVPTYTVTFDSNGGSSVPSQTVNQNSNATRPTDPTRTGYIFAGWYNEAELISPYNFNTLIWYDRTLYAKWDQRQTVGGGTTQGTLYMGMLGFTDNLTTKDISALNSTTSSQFTSFVDGLVIGQNTGLYYAVDTAVNMLETAAFPTDLANVSVITFTDGLDNSSVQKNDYYRLNDLDPEDYRDDLSKRLISGETRTTIGGVPIKAYSIGIRGGDVLDGQYNNFVTGFKAVSSTPALELNDPDTMAFLAEDMDQVNAIFGDIASELYRSNQLQTLTLEIPGGITNNTRVRYTFDNISPENVADSTLYIEGVYTRVSGVPRISDVVYHGLTSSSGTTIIGTAKAGKTSYDLFFDNISTPSGGRLEFVKANVILSKMAPGETSWGPESEFDPNEGTEPLTVLKSALIMVVLDCTNSLDSNGANRSPGMRAAAKNFIQVLVEAQQQ